MPLTTFAVWSLGGAAEARLSDARPLARCAGTSSIMASAAASAGVGRCSGSSPRRGSSGLRVGHPRRANTTSCYQLPAGRRCSSVIAALRAPREAVLRPTWPRELRILPQRLGRCHAVGMEAEPPSSSEADTEEVGQSPCFLQLPAVVSATAMLEIHGGACCWACRVLERLWLTWISLCPPTDSNARSWPVHWRTMLGTTC